PYSKIHHWEGKTAEHAQDVLQAAQQSVEQRKLQAEQQQRVERILTTKRDDSIEALTAKPGTRELGLE
ncbi:MAG TPA: hypothetical protein VKA13_06595, partial [Gammaproteobacteria bacterium]|nr:hypothetical protein [Gammaproteobacteria bacterium]